MQLKENVKVPNEMTDDLLIDSFKTMNQLKSNDSYRSKLLDQHQQVNQKLTHFMIKRLKILKMRSHHLIKLHYLMI